ncbi:MAG TPA: CHAT domain-containing protein [Bryobacteraceae bacterium]|nr:CHAT domain-containing protein [Bryobacteraceae bacterium]
MAVEMGDASETAAIDANLCSLYMEMGDLDEAGRRIEGVLQRLTGRERNDHLAETEILLAELRARQHRMAEASSLFRQGINAAEAQSNWKLAASAWNRIGEEQLKQGHLDAAEPALLEAYRIRSLRNLPLDTSYRNLGRLRLEQGDLAAAERLLNQAVELSAHPRGPIPSWDIYHYRGRVRLAQGRLVDAMSDLRTAVRLARAWRWSAPPDDAIRIGAEGWLDKVYSAFIDAGARLSAQTHDPNLIRETFEASEENRSSSLRTLIEGRIAAAEALPSSYWPAVNRLQRAEVEVARLRTPASEQEALSDRAALAQIESDAYGEPVADSSGLLKRVQERLSPSEALLAFHLGDKDSWLWAVERNRISLYALPQRQRIDAEAQAFSQSVQGVSGNFNDTGRALYTTLFGQLPPEVLKKQRWLLALDSKLFQVPFAALPAEAGDHSASSQAERRVIEVVPGAALLSAQTSQPRGGLFLGVADPIYNPADPRRTPAMRRSSASSSTVQLTSYRPLPRLVASASELTLASNAWSGDHELLEGAAASRTSVTKALAHNPDVIHFATHFVQTPGPGPQGAIALSMAAGGQADLLDPSEIARWRVNANLIALSGCYSSAGAIRPGSGLLGLTRAFLAAGAHNVLASLWDVPDDGGPFFEVFYRLLGQSGWTPAAALRAAQMQMIASGGWRANPRYWAAYFVMGKE